MIEAITQDNKLFQIFFMKDTDYVINIMESWTTLDELEGAKTRRELIYRSFTKDMNHLHTCSHLEFILGTYIKWTTKKLYTRTNLLRWDIGAKVLA